MHEIIRGYKNEIMEHAEAHQSVGGVVIENNAAIGACWPLSGHIHWIKTSKSMSAHGIEQISSDNLYLISHLENNTVKVTDITGTRISGKFTRLIDAVVHKIRTLESNHESSILTEHDQYYSEMLAEIALLFGDGEPMTRHTVASGSEIMEIFSESDPLLGMRRYIELGYVDIEYQGGQANYAMVLSETFDKVFEIDKVDKIYRDDTYLDSLLETLSVDDSQEYVPGVILYRLRYIGDIKRIKILHYGCPMSFVVDPDFLVGEWSKPANV